MKIALDAMGGDHAPGEVIMGALQAWKEYGTEVVLVGDRDKIEPFLKDGGEGLEVVHAPEVIEMGDHPVSAVRRKKDSSIVRAVAMAREGLVCAVVSAGNTGAVMAAGTFGLGRIGGVDRPAIASVLPCEKGWTVLVDSGSNVDSRAKNLKQFGVMGYQYAKMVLGKEDPSVGLLNVGTEETKGNELVLEAFPLLKGAGINFIGNVEGRDIFGGHVDVVVCDGFVGNVVLKTAEGLAVSMMKMLKHELSGSMSGKIGAALAMPALRSLKNRMDYAEYGGAPLLGLNGVVIICHGSSRARAIRNAIKAAAGMAESGIIKKMQEKFTGGSQVELGSANG